MQYFIRNRHDYKVVLYSGEADSLSQVVEKAAVSSRAVSVRVERYSMSATVHVIVKSMSVDFAKVEAIATSRES